MPGLGPSLNDDEEIVLVPNLVAILYQHSLGRLLILFAESFPPPTVEGCKSLPSLPIFNSGLFKIR